MEINRLNQEELSYELTIRGLPTGKVEEMRASLRSTLKIEKDGKSTEVDPYPYTYEEDLQALKKKVNEIENLLESFEGDSECAEYRKILTKIEWAFGRLNRMLVDDDQKKREKASIRASLILALGCLKEKADGDDGASSDSSKEVDMKIAVLPRSRVSLNKWEVRFSGEPSQSVNSFLERVNELADARGVTKSQLFHSALDLFTDKALIWYRANKTSFNSWEDLVMELKKQFLPPDYDDRLLEEIKRRTQGRDEPMGMYIAVMSNMFSRLTVPIDDMQKLRILKRNIAPFYQTQLGLTEIKSIQELVELGRRLESIRSSVETFIPPPSKRNNHLLEPDLAYVTTEMTALATISRPGGHTDSRHINVRCFKCGRRGHLARLCNNSIRCYGCGAEGVIRSNCSRCRSRQDTTNRSELHNQSVSGNGNGARK